MRVREAQERLLAWGYALPKWGADGVGGTETQGALRDFQRDQGLAPSGVLDARTIARLKSNPQRSSVVPWWVKVIEPMIDRTIRRTQVFEALQGKKTYIAVAIAALVVIANKFFGPIPGIELDPDQWLVQLGALIFPASIRAAIPDKTKSQNGGSK